MLAFVFLLVIAAIFVVAYASIDEKAQDAYNKCTSGNRGECLVALNDFRKEVKNICNNGNEECEYGIEKYWLTAKDIGVADGYFDAALLEATLLTEQLYMQDETRNATIKAFSDVVREPIKVTVYECHDGNCEESEWEWQDTTIRYEVNENGTQILGLNIIYYLVDNQGNVMEIFAKEGGGGGGGPPANASLIGIYQIINFNDGTSVTNYYTQMEVNIEYHSDNWIKLIA